MINCNKCSDSLRDCLQCAQNYKLIGNACVLPTFKYLTFPPQIQKQSLLSLNVDSLNINKQNMLTVTLWIKYLSPTQSSFSDCIKILSFTKDNKNYICHNIKENSIKLFDTEKLAFSYNSADKIFGIWSFISVSFYSNFNLQNNSSSSNTKYFYNSINFGNKFNFYINDNSVDIDTSFNTLLNSVSKIDNLDSPYKILYDSLNLGNEFFGFVSEIRIYSNYILNPYSMINNSNKNNKLLKLFDFRSSTSNTPDTAVCLKDSDINYNFYSQSQNQSSQNYYSKFLGLDCRDDYNPFDFKSFQCSNQTYANYLNFGKRSLELQCSGCNGLCNYGCSNETINGCYCDFWSGNSYLTMNQNSKKLNCENNNQVDFSNLSTIIIPKVSVANNKEYSIEFWFYLYTYNYDKNNKNYNIPFNSHEIIWDLHMKIVIENVDNEIYYTCYPMFDSDNKNLNAANSQRYKIINPFMNWIYISCSTNVNKLQYILLDSNPTTLKIENVQLPDLVKATSTNLIIQPGVNARTNFGFFFIKELKLWNMYNLGKFSTNCV